MMATAIDSSALVGNTDLESRDGMVFESHEAAYCYYKEYAKSAGFGTAKLSSRRSRSSKEFIDAKFSCIRYGNKQQSDDAINPRPSPKIGCKASMHVKRRQDGKWYVYSFVKEHNHDLLPSKVHFFRSHRDPDPLKCDTKLRRRKCHSSGSKLFVTHQNVESLEGYMRNHHDKGRRLILDSGDAKLLFEFFTRMQEENPKFFYAVDFNEEHQLRNLFWVDAKGVEDYAFFNDVVFLETTYFSNRYKFPLVLFLGVNHHMMPTLFGCGLIADETAYTYVWLLQTWVLAMGKRPPEVILSDQKNDLKLAVGAVFPQTRHCFCVWHVLEKIPRQIEHVSVWHESFMHKLVKCVFKSSTEEQFEKRWWKLQQRFHLRDIEWIQSLYTDRRYWVPTFIRGAFFACFSSKARQESVAASFDKYINGQTTVREFIDKYLLILEDSCEEEAKADFDAWHERPELKSPSPFEKQVSLIYTREIFKKFQVEVLGAAACHLKKDFEDDIITMYTVKDFEDNETYIVEWNAVNLDIYCSCLCFEHQGYLCRHAIVVLQMSGVFSIPPKYVLKRWTNAAKTKNSLGTNLDEVQTRIQRFNDLCRRAVILCEEGSLSQESFDFAACSIKDAVKQCLSMTDTIQSGGERMYKVLTGKSNSYNYKEPDSLVTKTPGVSQAGKHQRNKKSHAIDAKIKVPQLGNTSTGTLDCSNHVDLSNFSLSDSHSLTPFHLQNAVPHVFQNLSSTQLHNMPSTSLEEEQIPS